MELNEYVNKRLKNKKENIKKFWKGYNDFKIGVILKEERLKSGKTQEEIAQKIHTTKSVISRIENHAENITIATLDKFANAIGKELIISLK